MLFNNFPLRQWKEFWGKVLTDRISLKHKLDAEGTPRYWPEIAAPVNDLITRIGKLIRNISSTGFDLIKISDTLKDSSSIMLRMADKTEVQSAYSIKAMNDMSGSINELSNSTMVVAESVAALKERTASAELGTEDGVKAIEALSENILKWADSNREFAASVSQIQKIVGVIKDISEQTKLLAFNAAMEAAGAGEAGKRFSIVAGEVRGLATKTALATKDVGAIVQKLIENAEDSCRTMESTLQQASVSIGKTKDVNASLKDILNEVGRISSTVNRIASVLDEQARVSEGVLSAASEVSVHASDTKSVAMEMDTISNTVMAAAMKLNDNLCIVKKDELDEEIEQTLRSYVSEIKSIIGASLAKQEIGIDDLFDENYTPVDGNKFRTRFDDLFASIVLPRIREWSQSHERVIYVVVMDRNGYMPVHVNQARAGLIMTDGVSLGGAKSSAIISRAFKRPKEAGGELVNDLSCPIVIEGRHWGCVRIGYLPLMG